MFKLLFFKIQMVLEVMSTHLCAKIFISEIRLCSFFFFVKM